MDLIYTLLIANLLSVPVLLAAVYRELKSIRNILVREEISEWYDRL
jgi:hypothetical protein